MKISSEERQEIIEICERYNIKNYTIRDDGKVDVDGDVNLNRRKLTKLPLKFGIVTGNFKCYNNKLTSLIGAPERVSGEFDCSFNRENITSLIGAPEKVGGDFDCSYNGIYSLEGAPKEIGGHFKCYNNYLTSLKVAPLIVKGSFFCENNPKDNPKELDAPLTIIGRKFINI